MRRIFGMMVAGALLPVAAAQAAKPEKHYAIVNEAVGVPVFPQDITDRPYEVIGPVHAGVRKATLLSNESSQAKIYRELWERAEKLGADAVIKATYGNAHVSAFSWGQTNAEGIAIRFVDHPAPSDAPAK